jgi:uncharacterized protein (DUF849 family)
MSDYLPYKPEDIAQQALDAASAGAMLKYNPSQTARFE